MKNGLRVRVRFLRKFSIFCQDAKTFIFEEFDFWPRVLFSKNLRFFFPKLRFLTKSSIFDQRFDYWSRPRVLTKSSIFDHKFLIKKSLRMNHVIKLFSDIRGPSQGGARATKRRKYKFNGPNFRPFLRFFRKFLPTKKIKKSYFLI